MMPGEMAEPLSRGVRRGWYRGWNGIPHLFARGADSDATTARTRCGILVTTQPWPSLWGEGLPEKPRCFKCQRRERGESNK